MATAVPFRIIAFHAHQCAEAALKGFLARHNVNFPFTHSISRLLELAPLWHPGVTLSLTRRS